MRVSRILFTGHRERARRLQSLLRLSYSLFRSPPEPRFCLGPILRHTSDDGQHPPQIVLTSWIALLGALPIQAHRLGSVFHASQAILPSHPEHMLGRRQPAVGYV